MISKEIRARIKAQNEARYFAGVQGRIEVKVRKCNVCGEKFESAGNRTCSSCKKAMRLGGTA